VTEQQPWEILNPRDALVEAARLNRSALTSIENGWTVQAEVEARIATSLSTYALAMYRREA
jgi:hypothetical protein